MELADQHPGAGPSGEGPTRGEARRGGAGGQAGSTDKLKGEQEGLRAQAAPWWERAAGRTEPGRRTGDETQPLAPSLPTSWLLMVLHMVLHAVLHAALPSVWVPCVPQKGRSGMETLGPPGC